MDPITALALFSAGLKLASGISQGIAGQQAGNAQADILEGNARLADRAAGDALQRGQGAEEQVRIRGGQVAGAQAAQLGAAGVSTSGGSGLDVLSNTAGLSGLDAQTVRANAAREAFGYQAQAGNFRRQAGLARASANNALLSGILGGAAGAAESGRPFLSVSGSGGGGSASVPSSGGGFYAGSTWVGG